MKRRFFPAIVCLLFPALLFACAPAGHGRPGPEGTAHAGDPAFRAEMLRLAGLIVRAYPEAGLEAVEDNDGLYLVMAGKRILFSPWDGCPLADPDDERDAPLCASFAQTYPVGSEGRSPARGFDPGRVRNEEFLKALYGEDGREVEKHLVTVDFFGEKLLFSGKHGAAAALERARDKIASAAEDDPGIMAYVLPTGGTFAWRPIKDSTRLSAHSFAVSVDLNIQRGVYWLWRPSTDAAETARKHYPQAIVDAFESEGFIWGGKWFSFDFMHFEYRPELVLSSAEQGEQGAAAYREPHRNAGAKPGGRPGPPTGSRPGRGGDGRNRR